MKKNFPEVCLVEPDIPQNTGSLARLCAGAACRLHLIFPLGFSVDTRQLQRPGLDYWPYLDLEVHDRFEDLFKRFEKKRVAFFSAKAQTPYYDLDHADLLVFGCETRGLHENFHKNWPESMYQIPLFHKNVRSFNLAQAASIVIYDQIRRRVP